MLVDKNLQQIILKEKYNQTKCEQKYYKIIEVIYKDFSNKKIDKLFHNYLQERKNPDSDIFKKNQLFTMSHDYTIRLIGIGGYGLIYKLTDIICAKINLNIKEDYHEYEIPIKINELNSEIGDMIVLPYTLIKKCEFNGIIHILIINIIFVYITYCYIYKIQIQTRNIFNKIETYDIITEYKLLFFKNEETMSKSVDFFNFLCIFYLKNYEYIDILKYLLEMIYSFKPALKKTNNKITSKNNKQNSNINNKGFLILMPLLVGDSMHFFINPLTKEIDNGRYAVKANSVYPHIFRMLFLQVTLFILKINQMTFFAHNDLKPDNILVKSQPYSYSLIYKQSYFLFSEGFQFKIADFDFAILPEYLINPKIKNNKLLSNSTWLTDIHYFVHNLFYFLDHKDIQDDEVFFRNLHEYFIKPFCQIDFNQMKKNNYIKQKNDEICCNEGRLYINKKEDISYLEKFLLKDLFDQWRKK